MNIVPAIREGVRGLWHLPERFERGANHLFYIVVEGPSEYSTRAYLGREACLRIDTTHPDRSYEILAGYLDTYEAGDGRRPVFSPRGAP